MTKLIDVRLQEIKDDLSWLERHEKILELKLQTNRNHNGTMCAKDDLNWIHRCKKKLKLEYDELQKQKKQELMPVPPKNQYHNLHQHQQGLCLQMKWIIN
jgi:hypothetical protein